MYRDIAGILKKNILFKNTDEGDINRILEFSSAKTVQLDKNSSLFFEGDIYRNICILIEGEILLFKNDEYGNRNIIDIVYPEQTFAESFALSEEKISPVTAVANKKSLVLTIDSDSLLNPEVMDDVHLLKERQNIINSLLKVFADKNLLLMSKIEILSRRNIREKILYFLEINSIRHNSMIFSIPYSRKDMADFLGVDRSALSRELSKLRDDGIIDFEKNTFKILKTEFSEKTL